MNHEHLKSNESKIFKGSMPLDPLRRMLPPLFVRYGYICLYIVYIWLFIVRYGPGNLLSLQGSHLGSGPQQSPQFGSLFSMSNVSFTVLMTLILYIASDQWSGGGKVATGVAPWRRSRFASVKDFEIVNIPNLVALMTHYPCSKTCYIHKTLSI